MKSQRLLCCLALALAPLATRAAYTPIAIQSSSYNADVIVESNASPRLTIVTTASVDNGTNNTANTWFEIGFDTNHPANGLPAAGSTFTALQASDHSFTMAPSYTQPNGILVDTTSGGAFTLSSPAAYTKLSFLGSGGNGGDSINVTVNHQDGTSETENFGCPDWFGGSGVAAIVGGRCNSTVNLTPEADGTSGDGLGNPRIYYRDITLKNTTSPVTNLVLAYSSGQASSHNDIMGVSGALSSGTGAFTPITVTGYTYDFVVEAGAPKDGRVMSETMEDSTNLYATTESMDATNNTGTSWYEEGYNLNNADSGSWNSPLQNLTGTGIPHPGTFVTNSTGDHIYQMPPDYTVNDAIYISTAVTNDTITLTTPAAYSGLSFLGSAGSGPINVFCIIHYVGGTSATNILTVNDWFDNSGAVAYVANGRVAVDSAQFSNISSGDPVLLENDVPLADTTDKVTSITLMNTNTTGGRFALFAVSGSAGALPPSITVEPVSANAYQASSMTFTSAATANVPVTYQWQKGTNGVYANLANGGNISGVTSGFLTINPVTFADAADYRMVATDSAGTADSGLATMIVFSTNTDVTQPGDPISVSSNVSPFGDGAPATAIDNSMNTKFGANFSSGTVPSLIVTPSVGSTILNGLRLYTGSDSTGRDPTSFELDGSINGGSTYTLIVSNSITLSDTRNTAAAVAPNPLTQVVTEVRFTNTAAYTTYRLSIPTQKGGAGNTQVQFEEMELLGVMNSVALPVFTTQPMDQRSYVGGSAGFNAAASYNGNSLSMFWMRGTNETYVALTDGGDISGSQTTGLSVSPVNFVDSADYIAVASSTAGYVTSSIAHLYAFSTNVDVTTVDDPIQGFGDTTGTRYTNNPPADAIDNDMIEYENGGSGLNASAGFAPFGGPVGLIVTPAVGSTVLDGIRVYPGADSAANDPSGYILEGSNDGGKTYSTISSGALSLPAPRNSSGLLTDPTAVNSVQEILFANYRGFTTYRLTFPNVVNSNSAAYLEVGDIELLGVPGTGTAQPIIGKATFSNGSLVITGTGGTASGSFVVQTNGNLLLPNGWGTAASGTYDASGNFTNSLPVNAKTPQLFYRIH
ncbi:MAG: immunoglobulin domain-containing protein [Verrucomicrobiae bacterium]|nr:immunoglobulin domain-containing protein [Verrucomicrobiae bacterium]